MLSYKNKDFICFLDLGMDILRKKWHAVILCHLNDAPVRFLELQRRTASISQKILTSSLKELETEGLITKKIYPEIPPKVEYFLSPKGKEIVDILFLIENWSKKYYGQDVLLKD